MPTGYTADVQSGKVTEFEEYAMQCARAFGALIMMRDDPKDAEIPESFEASDHHQKALDQANHDMQMFREASDEILATRQKSQFDQAMKSHEERLATKREQRKRYEAMLEKAKAYESPSPDHDDFKNFLVSQLENSIDWDCSEKHCEPPKVETFGAWKERERAELQRSISYHAKHLAEEVERARSRTEWVSMLRKSLTTVSV